MDLPVFSFVSHSSLLTVKSVDFVVAHELSLVMEIVHIFHSAYFDFRDAFDQFLIRTAL